MTRDPKLVFDLLRNYFICGAVIGVANVVGPYKYSNCAYEFNDGILPLVTAFVFYWIAVFLLYWNSSYAFYSLRAAYAERPVRRYLLTLLFTPVIIQLTLLLPLKEIGSPEKAAESKMCELASSIEEIRRAVKKIDDDTSKVPVYLRERSK